jgi:hypothetical protein
MDKLLDTGINIRKSIAMGEHEAQYGKDGKQPRQNDGKYDQRRSAVATKLSQVVKINGN